jgi:hypothetical protein
MPPDDWQYQEEELRAPTWAEIARLFSGLESPRPE